MKNTSGREFKTADELFSLKLGGLLFSATCEQGCVNGMCSAPNKCTCSSRWTGSACDKGFTYST